MSEKTSVLYVDDEPVNLLLFKRTFKQEYNVLTDESGSEGLKILNSEKDIKVVVSDMKMPEMDGIEFITLANQAFPDISYFIFTGFECTKEMTEALERKLILGYFRKPLNTLEITNAINEYLK